MNEKRLSRRDFLVSMLAASGAIIAAPSGILASSKAADPMAWPKDWPTKGSPLSVDDKRRTVKMYTEVILKNLAQTNPHWGIGCSTGDYADKFILSSPAKPTDFHDALVRMGAKAGNNLSLDSYGQVVAGDELVVAAQWPGLQKPVDIKDIFYDATGKGFRIRFGGNRTAAAERKAGCLTCLESCPIAITSNDVYPHVSTATRYFTPNSLFRGKPEVLPNAQSAPVVVFYRPAGKA